MRKEGPSKAIEVTLKVSAKGKEKEEWKEVGYISREDEVKFVNKLQLGTRRFRGKLPLKFLSCGRVGHYAAKFPHKENDTKGRILQKVIGNDLIVEEVIILMKIVMAYQIVKKVNLIKILN